MVMWNPCLSEMNYRCAVSVAVLFAFAASAGFAEDKSLSKSEIDRFVQQLVSPNEAPDTRGGSAVYPANYDHESQKKVRAAWQQLWRSGPAAFPCLFDHLDDIRYSFTEDGGQSDVNWSVGRACLDILHGQIEPLNVGRRHRLPSYVDHNLGKPANHNLGTPAEAKKWWGTHKSQSLYEMQIEALEWIIAETEKSPDQYSDETRKNLKDSLRELCAAKTPLKPVVPWPL